ncbi:MAG: ribbon-helix-helix protein, CopG family [Gemmatimonadetes bacterium]|nr:ribbon-helix-helix protein, CopG family [Gemmatimonadota bacterium]
MIKMTFTLDEDAVRQLERAAQRLSMPKSHVVREALRVYGEELGRLSEEERQKVLDIFDDVVPSIPDRPREEVERELADVRSSRRAGGRGTTVDPCVAEIEPEPGVEPEPEPGDEPEDEPDS